MRIGYASLTTGVRETNFKTCILKNATDENLLSIIHHNLDSLENIIDYNVKTGIKLFRISSGIIPFGSSSVNELKWWEIFSEKLFYIGSKIKKGDMRVSMHPGQYTVLNSPKDDVVERAIKDLEYHNKFLDSLNLKKEHKIILHIGGVYGDKRSAIDRFIQNYKGLNEKIKNRLVIENDDKSYNIEDVLYISKTLNIPVIYDNLHNKVLCSDPLKDDSYWIEKVRGTWKKGHGTQKIHYSQQDPTKKPGAHSKTIKLSEFLEFVKGLDFDIHIMLEVKDKNLSAIKCINGIENNNVKVLELQWSKYKYSVLERSPLSYNKIRSLLKNKEEYPVLEFYKIIGDSLEIEETIGNTINAAQHIWGYFKSQSSESEKKRFEKMIIDYRQEKIKKNRIKNFLNKLSIKYNQKYLLDSYYFFI